MQVGDLVTITKAEPLKGEELSWDSPMDALVGNINKIEAFFEPEGIYALEGLDYGFYGHWLTPASNQQPE